MILIGIYASKTKPMDETRNWMKEALWFVRIILPFLLAGVFLAAGLYLLLKSIFGFAAF
jgi:uncharacterized membrane protein YraQ (UPF0718 family)